MHIENIHGLNTNCVFFNIMLLCKFPGAVLVLFESHGECDFKFWVVDKRVWEPLV
jgi:hypothetical protein